MSLEGPQIRYARVDEAEDVKVARALELSRQVELLLESIPESTGVSGHARAQSTRMARAMAASLVDELEGLVRGRHRGGVASG